MEFNDDALRELYITAAQKIEKKMRDVRNDVKSFERNWIWELIQNAKDNVAAEFADKKVSIKIDVTPESLIFAHNYGYFTKSNVEGIIRQSSKKDNKKQAINDNPNIIIGRFGTGFMTTHLLSKKIYINAIYRNDEGYKNLEFPIDRSDIEIEALVDSIEKSFDIADKSTKKSDFIDKDNIDFFDYNSRFSYELVDDKSKAIADIGIKDLFKSLPYTLVFVDGIEKVEINNLGIETSFVKLKSTSFSDTISSVDIIKTTEGETELLTFVYLKKSIPKIYKKKEVNVNVQIAIQLEKNVKSYSFKSIDKLPFIYLDFPLIGTENFHLPTIVNFPLFEPTEARDGVFLEQEGEESIANQEVFKTILDLLLDLIDFSSKKEWKNLYNLAKTTLPEDRKGFSKEWFKENFQTPLRTHLLKSKIVETESSLLILEEALFPYNSNESRLEKLWNLVKVLHGDKLPKLEHLEYWHKIIDRSWSKNLRYDLKKMVIEVATFSNLSKLSEAIHLTEEKTLNWLDKVIEFTIEKDEKLLSEYAIIPNQLGNFKVADELWFDDNISEELKETSEKLNINWRIDLQHKQIISYQPVIKKRNNEVISKINSIIKSDNEVINREEVVLDLLSYFPYKQDHDVPPKQDLEKNQVGEKYWQYAKDFYQETPNKIYLENWEEAIWEEANKWFIKTLIVDISEFKTITGLIQHIKKEDSLVWLNSLLGFITEQKYESYLNEYAIVPNQEGNFKILKNLWVDEHIPEELKNILDVLKAEWYSKLQHKQITSIKSGITKTIDDITNRINTIIKKNEDSNLVKTAVLDLLSCFPSENSKYSPDDEKYWQYAKEFYKETPDKKVLNNWNEIIWEEAKTWFMDTITSDITKLGYINNLGNRLDKDNTTIYEWYNNFLDFVVKQKYARFLSSRAILPNQKGQLKKREELWLEDNIPNELKDILKESGNDWYLKLQHTEITAYESAPTKTINDIVGVINTHIKANDKEDYEVIKKSVLALLSYFPTSSNDTTLVQEKYLKFAKDFYTETPDKKELKHHIGIVWEVANEWFIKTIITDIANLKSVKTLEEHINITDGLKWLHRFINFISENELERYLENHAILPNQHNDFCLKSDLWVDEDYEPEFLHLEQLKDILELLDDDCRAELLSMGIALDIKGKEFTTKHLANRVIENIDRLLQKEGIKQRSDKAKNIFSKMLLWFHGNESKSEEYFKDLYEKRHRLRSDDELIEDIKFRQSLMDNENGYSKEEIFKLVNIPKEKVKILTEEEFEAEVEKRIQEKLQNTSHRFDDEIKERQEPKLQGRDLITSLGITTEQEFEEAKVKFEGTTIGESLRHHSTSDDYQYVRAIIERAKKNVKEYLEQDDKYDTTDWFEESFTVIRGIKKEGKDIKIVIRPSEGGAIIIWYKEELDTLEQTGIFTELWHDNIKKQAIYSFGKLLRRASIDRLPI